jgi:nucleoside phosphorylase
LQIRTIPPSTHPRDRTSISNLILIAIAVEVCRLPKLAPAMPPRPIEEYQVGWVCALPKEMAAARAVLDEEHGPIPSQDAQDRNNYVLGHVHNHNVVIACLPAGVDGNNAAAVVAANMLRTFKGLRFGLMVGIGGGIPNLDKGVDIRLGDVVVSQPDKTYGGVVQCDKGKSLEGGQFERKGSLNKPPSLLLNALASLQAQHEVHGSQISTYLTLMIAQHPHMEENGYTFPGVEQDCLYCTHYRPISNKSCDKCQGGKVRRKERRHTKPVIHYGIIASGNQVVKDSVVRDRLGAELEAKCVEMEAAGLMDDFPCLVIRGVCDYADAYKNDIWHRYAATTAAAYAKEFLSIVPPQLVSQVSCASDVMSKSTSNFLQIE